MLLCLVLMYTTAHKKISQQYFEAFWYTHRLAFVFMLPPYSHTTGCFVRDSVDPEYISSFPFYSTEHCLGYLSWRFIIWTGIIYVGERMWKEIRARRSTNLQEVLVHPSGAMELRIVKPSFKYTSGQWLFIQVPEVSRFQWHPVRFFFRCIRDSTFIRDISSSLPQLPKIPMFPSILVRLVTGRTALVNMWCWTICCCVFDKSGDERRKKG